MQNHARADCTVLPNGRGKSLPELPTSNVEIRQVHSRPLLQLDETETRWWRVVWKNSEMIVSYKSCSEWVSRCYKSQRNEKSTRKQAKRIDRGSRTDAVFFFREMENLNPPKFQTSYHCPNCNSYILAPTRFHFERQKNSWSSLKFWMTRCCSLESNEHTKVNEMRCLWDAWILGTYSALISNPMIWDLECVGARLQDKSPRYSRLVEGWSEWRSILIRMWYMSGGNLCASNCRVCVW